MSSMMLRARRRHGARRPHRNHSPAFKAKVAVAAIKGEKTLHAKIGELTLESDFCPARSARRACCRA